MSDLAVAGAMPIRRGGSPSAGRWPHWWDEKRKELPGDGKQEKSDCNDTTAHNTLDTTSQNRIYVQLHHLKNFEKGTTNGTQTDFDGNYTLDGVDANAVLVVSYIGYATQEVPVNGRSTINITLAEDAQALDEVVIIGYGQTTVKDATGAIAAWRTIDR